MDHMGLHHNNENRMANWQQDPITNNDHQYGCPIIYTDIFHNAIFFIDTSNNALYNLAHWLIETPYLAILAGNELSKKDQLAPQRQ